MFWWGYSYFLGGPWFFAGDKFRFPFSMIQSWEFNGMPPFYQEIRSKFCGDYWGTMSGFIRPDNFLGGGGGIGWVPWDSHDGAYGAFSQRYKSHPGCNWVLLEVSSALSCNFWTLDVVTFPWWCFFIAETTWISTTPSVFFVFLNIWMLDDKQKKANCTHKTWQFFFFLRG